MKFEATLNPNATAGNFFGDLRLSFNANNDNSQGQWTPAQVRQTFTVPGSAEVSVLFSVGREGAANEFNLYASIGFSDPRVPLPQYTFPNANPVTLPGAFVPGTAGMRGGPWEYSSGDVPLFANNGAKQVGTIHFSFSLPVQFNGTEGNGNGMWSLKYTLNS